MNYLKGKASQEECIEVESWSEASATNRKMLEDLYYILFLSDRQATMNAIDIDKSLAGFKKNLKQKELKPKSYLGWKRYVVNIAAFLIGAVFAAGAFEWYSHNYADSYVVSTESGQRARVVLPDGTYAWLNSSTTLAYKESFWGNNRSVDLAGEAYFEVNRNEYAPFTVHSKNVDVVVLGTKFNVRAHSSEQRVVTTLFRGSVCVDDPSIAGEGFILKPGQTLDVNVKTHNVELKEYATPTDILLWINGSLIFEQATLADIASVLEKHFDVRFAFADDQLKNERFTCQFSTDDNIDQILSVISLTGHLTYRKEAKIVHLMNKK